MQLLDWQSKFLSAFAFNRAKIRIGELKIFLKIKVDEHTTHEL